MSTVDHSGRVAIFTAAAARADLQREERAA